MIFKNIIFLFLGVCLFINSLFSQEDSSLSKKKYAFGYNISVPFIYNAFIPKRIFISNKLLFQAGKNEINSGVDFYYYNYDRSRIFGIAAGYKRYIITQSIRTFFIETQLQYVGFVEGGGPPLSLKYTQEDVKWGRAILENRTFINSYMMGIIYPLNSWLGITFSAGGGIGINKSKYISSERIWGRPNDGINLSPHFLAACSVNFIKN